MEIAAAAIGRDEAERVAGDSEDGDAWASLYGLAQIRLALAGIRRAARRLGLHTWARRRPVAR